MKVAFHRITWREIRSTGGKYFQAVCTYGWRGPERAKKRDAVIDAINHKDTPYPHSA